MKTYLNICRGINVSADLWRRLEDIRVEQESDEEVCEHCGSRKHGPKVTMRSVADAVITAGLKALGYMEYEDPEEKT